MQTITLVTGNAGKLAEWQRLLPAEFKLESANIDLDEIQSLDLEAIVIDKAKRAFDHIGKPVIVEDVSAGLVKFGGLPGPFAKFFEVTLGPDALFQLAGESGSAAIVTCCAAFYDGTTAITARGDITGKVVAARGENGFGFDSCFMPDGSDKTFAEMSFAEKDSFSHRAHAIKALLTQLKKL
jgi:non-canonical purine NTP pyrophosphatase (RdgB/HAM1 family)